MTEALGCVENLFGVGLFTASDLHDGVVGEPIPIVEPQEIAAPWNYQSTIAVLFTVWFRPHMKVHLIGLKGWCGVQTNIVAPLAALHEMGYA